MSISALAFLACGDFEKHVEINDVFDNLANTITELEKKVVSLPEENDENITLYGPFLARTLLETVCTAIVGRIDPFRLLVVKNVQEQDSFGLGSRSNVAIKWFGDIFEEGLSVEQRVPQKMWRSNLDFSKIGRGLLGDYYGSVFWRSAYESLLDKTINYPDGDFIEDYRRSFTPENFMIRIRHEASRLYSSLSKGVHSELVVKSELIYDRTTVLELVSDTLRLCGILSLVSHQIYSSICHVELSESILHYNKLLEGIDNYGR